MRDLFPIEIGVNDNIARAGKVLPTVNDPGDGTHDSDDGDDDDNVVH